MAMRPLKRLIPEETGGSPPIDPEDPLALVDPYPTQYNARVSDDSGNIIEERADGIYVNQSNLQGPPGPQGPIGPAGPAGSGGGSIITVQSIATLTLTNTDLAGNKIKRLTNTTPIQVLIPLGLTGTQEVTLFRDGTGAVDIIPAPGVTLLSADGRRNLRSRYSSATIIPVATNVYYLVGDIEIGDVLSTQWRLNFTYTSVSFVEIQEMEFRETAGVAQQATGGTPFASTQFGVSFGAAKAFDGLVSGADPWSSNLSGMPQHVGYTYPAAFMPVELWISQGGRPVGAHSFDIQYNDGAGWVTTRSYVNPIWSTGDPARTFAIF